MSRLVAPVIAALALGTACIGIVGGGPQSPPLMLAAPLVLGGLGWALFRRTGGRAVELRWTGGSRLAVAPTATEAGPSGGPWRAAGPPPATRRQVVAALGRAEARQWVSSPWLAVGVGFCLLLTVLLGWVFTADSDGVDGTWRDWFVLMPIMAHPLVGMTVLGAHHAVTRGRRSHAEELFAACPTDEAARTAAHLRSSWVPAVVMVAFVVASTASIAYNSPNLYGPIDGRALADSLAGIVLVVCGAWLGVALGRWAPWTLTPVIVVLALVPVIVGLGNLGEPHWSNVRQLSTWPRFPDHDLIFTAPRVWWHLLWLAGLGTLMGAIAVAHARRDRRLVLTAAAIVAVTVVAAAAQSLPLSDGDAGGLASLVAEPERHQTCRSDGRAEVCVYRGYERYLERTIAHAAPVVAAAPRDIDGFTFRQEFDGDRATLGPEVNRELALIEPTNAVTSEHLPLGYSTTEEAMDAVRLIAALHAVDLPVRATAEGVPLVIAGEARGVVALWLAGRGLNVEDAQRLARPHYSPGDDIEDSTPTALDLGMAWPDPCIAGSPPVAWAAQDLAAARALMALPDRQVLSLLHGGWARFTDETTTTDDLLRAAGLDPVGPPDDVEAVPVTCSY